METTKRKHTNATKNNGLNISFYQFTGGYTMAVPFQRFPRLKETEYSIARKEIKSGDILLCSGNSVISEMIKRATKGIWSHVAFLVRLEYVDRIMVFESVESIGVRCVPLSYYVNGLNGKYTSYDGKILIARHTDFENKMDNKNNRSFINFMQFAIDHLGFPYDSKELARILARIVGSKIGFKHGEVKRDDEFICSEYAYECFNIFGIKIKYDKRGFIAPVDFAKEEKVNPVVSIKIE